MEIKELRIGNWVMAGGEEWQKEGERELRQVVGSDFGNPFAIEFIDPIELTPEWLTKLGWGKSEEHEMGHNAYEPWGFYYDYHFKRFRIENSETDWDVEMPNIKYLHQVQNVIFALTGEELAIDKTSLKN